MEPVDENLPFLIDENACKGKKRPFAISRPKSDKMKKIKPLLINRVYISVPGRLIRVSI